MRNGKLGGRGVTEQEFHRTMQGLGAAAATEWTRHGIYDPVSGDLMENYQDWHSPDGRVVARIEQYYWHGERHELCLIFDEENPDKA